MVAGSIPKNQLKKTLGTWFGGMNLIIRVCRILKNGHMKSGMDALNCVDGVITSCNITPGIVLKMRGWNEVF
jgi:hypothetical protein